MGTIVVLIVVLVDLLLDRVLLGVIALEVLGMGLEGLQEHVQQGRGLHHLLGGGGGLLRSRLGLVTLCLRRLLGLSSSRLSLLGGLEKTNRLVNIENFLSHFK